MKDNHEDLAYYARILLHSHTTDNRPPQYAVDGLSRALGEAQPTDRGGDPKQRLPVLWSCDDGEESLHCDDKDDAIEEYLEQQIDSEMTEQELVEELSLHSPLEVYGYAPQVARLSPSDLLEYVLEELDSNQELGDPGGDTAGPTPRMREIAELFCRVILEEYHPWAHEVIVTEEVDCVTWAREHKPDWFAKS